MGSNHIGCELVVIMKLLAILLVASTSFALPQRQTAEVYEEPLEFNPETTAETVDDAEFLPESEFDQMPESDADYNPGRDIFILRFRPRPIWNFDFPRYAHQAPAFPPPRHFFNIFGTPQREEEPAVEEHRPSLFQTFFDLMRPSTNFGPDFSSLPGNYSNSTHEIMDINGTNVAVNQTIRKTSGDNFHNFFHFKVIQVLPDGEVVEEDTPVAVEETPEGEVILEPLPGSTTDESGVVSEGTGYEFLPEENADERENELVPVQYDEEQVSPAL